MPRDPITRLMRPLSTSEARDRYLELVGYDKLGLLLKRPQDQNVYHYTNLAGLRGILESKSIWASDYRFLNDSSEIAFGLEIIEMMLAGDPDLHLKLAPELRQKILMSCALLIENRSSHYVFSASFCSKGNLLSQWRGYGRENGLAVEFTRCNLEAQADRLGFKAGRVHYYFDPRQNDEPGLGFWFEARIASLSASIAKIRIETTRSCRSDSADVAELNCTQRCARAIDVWLLETAAFIKHPIFSEEEEWRCVTCIERHQFFEHEPKSIKEFTTPPLFHLSISIWIICLQIRSAYRESFLAQMRKERIWLKP